MQQIIDKIKETTTEKMNLWKIEMFHMIKKMEKDCSDLYDDPRYLENKNSYTMASLKRGIGWTPSIDSFMHRSVDDLRKKIEKEAKNKLLKIDVAVKKKLKDIDVKLVEEISFTPWSANGFCEGSWLINGSRVFSFRSIYAGGFNIQCLHVRTIYKFK